MKQARRGVSNSLVLFARVGWMRFYNGSVAGDERPVGGGRYNKTKIGHEVYNFRNTEGRLYGYFQPVMSSHAVALERIDPNSDRANKLSHVLVIFVARRPEGRQVIVGWYRDAEVLREQAARSPGKPRGFGHFCAARAKDCVLLPAEKRTFEILPAKAAWVSQMCVIRPIKRERQSARNGSTLQPLS